MLKLVPEIDIQEMEDDQQKALDRMLEQQLVTRSEAWKEKEAWLSVFAITLSPKLACKRTGVSNDRYRRWRKTCPQFCRALNQVIQEANEELVGSALARATGYLRREDETNEIVADGEGRPIRFGASDSLARSILGMSNHDRPQEGLTVTINLEALTGVPTPEGEGIVIESGPDETPPAA